eukprot:m.118901 g.118901  ORF g.118901 m.118901 type:complete len:235 (-) comp9535_c0_seq6:187-891(-)
MGARAPSQTSPLLWAPDWILRGSRGWFVHKLLSVAAVFFPCACCALDSTLQPPVMGYLLPSLLLASGLQTIFLIVALAMHDTAVIAGSPEHYLGLFRMCTGKTCSSYGSEVCEVYGTFCARREAAAAFAVIAILNAIIGLGAMILMNNMMHCHSLRPIKIVIGAGAASSMTAMLAFSIFVPAAHEAQSHLKESMHFGSSFAMLVAAWLVGAGICFAAVFARRNLLQEANYQTMG